MEKLNTLSTSTVEQFVNQAITYVQHWTKKELLTILEKKQSVSSTPVIIQIGKRGFLVGNYAMQPIERNWWRVSYRYDEEAEYIFSTKASALYFIYYRHKNNFQRSDNILTEDEQVRRWQLKSDHYQYRYKQCLKKKNYDKADLFYNRYQEAMCRLNHSKNLLEKSLKSAKYF